METPAQRCARIVSALEDLVNQEAAALRAGDFDAVNEIQDRAAPLVEFLALHATEGDTPQLRACATKCSGRPLHAAGWRKSPRCMAARAHRVRSCGQWVRRVRFR
jgi:hypothetical protein